MAKESAPIHLCRAAVDNDTHHDCFIMEKGQCLTVIYSENEIFQTYFLVKIAFSVGIQGLCSKSRMIKMMEVKTTLSSKLNFNNKKHF